MDVVKAFENKNNKELNDSEFQSSFVANNPICCLVPVMFPLIDLDTPISKVNLEKGFKHMS